MVRITYSIFKEFRYHLIRVSHDGAIYQEDPDSHRLSVIVPVERPQPGGQTFDFSLKFMCLGSDVGGINRRPLKVIFTLEEHSLQNGDLNVLGRYTVDVRICSCPKRDKIQEEKRNAGIEKHARQVAETLARTNSSLALSNHTHSMVSGEKDTATGSKKRRIDTHAIEEMVMVPVRSYKY